MTLPFPSFYDESRVGSIFLEPYEPAERYAGETRGDGCLSTIRGAAKGSADRSWSSHR